MKMTNQNPFSDAAIKEILFDRRNLEPLEFLIEKETAENQDFLSEGKRIYSVEEIRERLFPEVKETVDELLGVNNVPPAKIERIDFSLENILNLIFVGVTGAYNDYLTKIKVPILLREERIKAILAHEYAHHTQSYFEVLSQENLAFNEGHASGVQNQAVKNRIFSNLRIKYLEAAYVLINRATKNKPKLNVSKTALRCSTTNSAFFDYDVIINYRLGTTFFALSELKHGPSVYARALRRDEGILQLH